MTFNEFGDKNKKFIDYFINDSLNILQLIKLIDT